VSFLSLHIFIYFQDRSAYSAAGNMWTDPGNIEIAHRHMNVEIGHTIPRKGIHKWDFPCSVCLSRSEYGRLGLGPKTCDAKVPTLIPTLTNMACVEVACGTTVSFAITESGLHSEACILIVHPRQFFNLTFKYNS
jgi:hypothetical protein